MDISLYEGEDQLDEIERRRKREERKKKRQSSTGDEDKDFKAYKTIE